MKKLLIICGPTATGKTQLGIQLARMFDGEIISADSRQIYRQMDILTGKDLDVNSELIIKNSDLGVENQRFTAGYRLKEGIPVWLVDIVDPDYPFNISDFARLAHTVMKNIWSRNRLPIAVGGSGLYLKSLVEYIDTILLPPNKLLRKELENSDLSILQQKLIDLDLKKWETMNYSDQQNPRRIIRAIEISAFREDFSRKFPSLLFNFPESILKIGLVTSTKNLYQIIDNRVEERIKNGAVAEVERLRGKKYSWILPALTSTGASEINNFIDKKITLSEAIQAWKFREHRYARRQITWFKKEKKIIWFDIVEEGYQKQIEKTVKKWYTSH